MWIHCASGYKLLDPIHESKLEETRLWYSWAAVPGSRI